MQPHYLHEGSKFLQDTGTHPAKYCMPGESLRVHQYQAVIVRMLPDTASSKHGNQEQNDRTSLSEQGFLSVRLPTQDMTRYSRDNITEENNSPTKL
jgi:hypothetical protein